MSIGGYAFTLEKDASAEAGKYLGGLEAHYLGQQGGKEIMEGIEERMAELLLDRCGQGGIATVADIRAIIEIIGRPESIEADDPAPEDPGEKKRKLFRDLENKRLGGVCAGLATYFDTDVSWLRLGVAAAAVIIFLTGAKHGVWCLLVPVLYCLLWVAMPAARTAQDRWAMKGDSGTLDDIRRNVSSGVREMGQAANEVVKSDTFKQVGKIFLIIIGLVLLITGTSGLASASLIGLNSGTLFSESFTWMQDQLIDLAPQLLDLLSVPWVLTLVILAVLLPFIGMIYGGVQLIFGFKSPSWKPGMVLFVSWLVIIIVLLVLVVAQLFSTELLFI